MLTSTVARGLKRLTCLWVLACPAFAAGVCAADSPGDSLPLLPVLGLAVACLPALWRGWLQARRGGQALLAFCRALVLRRARYRAAAVLPAAPGLRPAHGWRVAACGALLGASALVLVACGSSSGGGSTATSASAGLHGAVHGGRQPVVSATVLVYEASLTAGTAPQQVGNTTTASDGTWNIATLSTPPAAGQVVYVVALGGQPTPGVANPNAALMTALVADSNGNLPALVNVDELSTVAVTSQLQNYLTEVDCSTITGTSISTTGQSCPSITGAAGLSARAGTIGNLVNVVTGGDSTFLTANAGGSKAINTTLQNLNFEASVLASCINSAGGVSGDSSACGNLFALVPTPGTGVMTPIPGSPFAVGAGPVSVTISANGKFAYVINQASSGTIKGFSINPSTGALTAIAGSPFAAGNNPQFMAISPNGQFAYVDNFSGNSISAYTINSSTGALTPMAGSPFATGTNPYDVVISPNGAFVYAANAGSNSISAFSVDSSTGGLTPLSGSPFASGNSPQIMTVSPNGNFAYVANIGGNNISAYSIDENSADATYGALTSIGTVAAGAGAQAIVLSPNGNFAYEINYNAGTIRAYSADSGTGALTTVGTYATGANPNDLAISPDGSLVYVANNPGTVSVYSADAGTGALTPITGSPFTTSAGPLGLTVSPNGSFLYVPNDAASSVTAYSTNANGTTDTLKAALTLAGSASNKSVVTGLFALAPAPAVYTPIPSAAPASWSVGGSEFVYAANQSTNNVSAYSLDSSSGVLTQLTGSPFTAGSGPLVVTVSPNGAFAYVANEVSGNVSAYSIDPATGVLTAVAGSPFTAGADPSGLTVSADGKFVYAANQGSNTVSVFAVTPGSGVLTLSGSVATGTQPFAITLAPNGAFAYVADFGSNAVSAYSINSGTGALTAVTGSPFATGSQPLALTVSPNGAFAYVTSGSGNLYAYSIDETSSDPTYGALTALSGSPFATGGTPDSVTVSPNGAFAYATLTNNTLAAFSIDETSTDPTYGALTVISGSPFAAGSNPQSVVLTPNGAFAINADAATTGGGVTVYTVNSSTGAVTTVAGSPFAAGTTALSVAVSP